MLKIFCLTLITLLIVLYVQARRAARDIRRNRVRSGPYYLQDMPPEVADAIKRRM